MFRTITDVAHYPEWRSDVTAIEMLSAAPLRWRESGSNGDIVFVAVESREPSRFEPRLDDPAARDGELDLAHRLDRGDQRRAEGGARGVDHAVVRRVARMGPALW